LAKVKIKVVKMLSSREVFDGNPPAEFNCSPKCDEYEIEEGREFIVDDSYECPSGFCPWAYADIQRDIVTLLHGGNFPWMKKEGELLSCCTDGIRPVIFFLERIED